MRVVWEQEGSQSWCLGRGGRRVRRPHLSEVQAKVDRYELQMRRPGLLSGYYGYRGKWSLVREPQTCWVHLIKHRRWSGHLQSGRAEQQAYVSSSYIHI